MNYPTKEQREALLEYRTKTGRNWRSVLLKDWTCGVGSPTLLQIRSQFGFKWLKSVNPDTLPDPQIQTVADHFIIAALWADCPEGSRPKASNQAKQFAYKECERFIKTYPELFQCAMMRSEIGYGSHPDAGSPEAAFGHDLYLSRQGHGAGFLDRQELKLHNLGKSLDYLVGFRTDFPEMYLEFHRGWLHFQEG